MNRILTVTTIASTNPTPNCTARAILIFGAISPHVKASWIDHREHIENPKMNQKSSLDFAFFFLWTTSKFASNLEQLFTEVRADRLANAGCC
jgi:hypothetical protein